MNELVVIVGGALAALGAVCYLICRRSDVSRSQNIDTEPDARSELWNLELRRRLLTKHEQMDQLRGEFKAVMTCGMTAASLMTEQVISAPPEALTSELRELMHRINTRHVLVCEPAEHLLGVVSDRDVHRRAGRTACDIMTTEPHTVSPLSSVSRAITLMVSEQISCVPVVDRGQLSGVLTTTDMLMALESLLEICEERMGIKAMSA